MAVSHLRVYIHRPVGNGLFVNVAGSPVLT